MIEASLIVIPGWRGADAPVPEALQEALREAVRRGARIADNDCVADDAPGGQNRCDLRVNPCSVETDGNSFASAANPVFLIVLRLAAR